MGPQTADKRTVYINDINKIMTENPNAKIFIIVPEHAKFDGEVTILQDLWESSPLANESFMGSINLQVFSFSRLAWYFLKDEEVFHKKQLSDAGMAMMLRKILLNHKEELIIFRKEIDKEGFIQQLINLFKELLAGNITIEDLEQTINKDLKTPELLDQRVKLSELLTLYRLFMNEIEKNDFIQYEMIQEALAQSIYQEDMQDVYLYVDGYYHFTAREIQIIMAFLERAEKVSIVLDLDKPYIDKLPEMQELFYVAGKTYHTLYQLARKNQVRILQDIRLPVQENGYTEGLRQLDTYWRDTNSAVRSKDLNTEKNSQIKEVMEIWSCETKQAEIFHVANSINRLVTESGYRYKDFLIVARRVEDYETILKPLFTRAQLPVFYDKADEMKHHPFTDFIDSLFKIRMNYWRYPDLMRLLRTELLLPTYYPGESGSMYQHIQNFRNKVDQTENIILAYGFEGNAWFNQNDWQQYVFSEEEIDLVNAETDAFEDANVIKNFLQATLLPFYKKLSRAKTGRDAAILLYEFLTDHAIDQQILHWRDRAIEEDNLEQARQHEQLWQTFNLLLDEYVETLGDERFDEKTFYTILMTGFESATYSIVPPTLDEVIFSSMEGARFKPAKIVYVIGASQENLPQLYENKTLLTEEERQFIQTNIGDDSSKYLNLNISESTASEPYIAYQTFLSGSERLFVTYPLSIDGNNRINQISPYVARIAKDLNISVQYRAANVTDARVPLNFAGNKEQNVGQLVQLLREQLTTNKKMPFLWRQILTYLAKDKSIQPVLTVVFSSLKYKNTPVQLTAEIAEKLYGKDLYLSVSQLESYYLDAYSHYLKYGLQLKERQKYELSNAATGEFYHEALEFIVRELRGKGKLSISQVQAITTAILKELFGIYKYEILSSSNRMKFIQDQLAETIQHMSQVITSQGRLTTFENLRTEATFGLSQATDQLEGLTFPLKQGRSINIRGKIDRIDRIKSKDKQFLTILDYKSSQHRFDFNDAYYGLAMQMITYLDVAMVNASKLVKGQTLPAGAFYLHVQHPYLKVQEQPTVEELEDFLLSNNKLKGLLVADKEITESVDPSVTEGEASLVLPFRYNKSGGFGKVADLIQTGELDLLIKNNRRRIVQAGNRILSGDLRMNPIKGKAFIPTVQGPYRAISQFDSTLNENRYRRIERLDKEAVIELLRLEFAEEDNDEEKESGE